jgi:lysophospholipase L1-like esterase
MSFRRGGLLFLHVVVLTNVLSAQDDARWKFSPEALQPFWQQDVVQDEPVLFIRDPETGEAKASLLFPVRKIISVRNSTSDTTYQPGTDFQIRPGSRELIAPSGSHVISRTAADLRRPANTQRHRLTHRDGNGEILFGAKLEYHDMQTLVTYSKADDDWPVPMPVFDSKALPRTITKLREGQPITIVLLGDSISTGCNASGWADGAPFQPAFPELVRQHLESRYKTNVTLVNLAVGGKSTPWGVTMADEVAKHAPDLVLLAFGMNDSARLSAEEYGTNTAAMISQIRGHQPTTEFILVATMLGNRDWTLLRHEVFPKYRDELERRCESGVALADMTSVWEEFLKRKQNADLTGNGVNHPNDFGHRVYAQVIARLLVDESD